VVLTAGLASWLLTDHGAGGLSVVLLPAIVLLHLPMISGLALGLAALTVHFKDVRDLLANLLTLLFFLTPILYPLESIQHLKPVWWIVRLNPFTPFTLAYQEVLFHGRWPTSQLWVQMALVSLACWLIGTWFFERLRETLVEAV
jgi:lipopolysaccharide transport system permease protein